MMTDLRTGWIESFDSTRIYFEERGEGLPIIMCNGILCRMTTYWGPLATGLAGRHRTVNWDYRGHGRSTLPPDVRRCSMEDFCRDLRALMDHLGIDRAVLAGHSLGTQLILESWRHFPERIAGIISICGPYERPFATFYGTSFFEFLFQPLCRLGQAFHLPLKLTARLLRHSLTAQVIARSGPVHWLLCPWRVVDDYTDHLANLDYRFALRAMAQLAAHSAADLLGSINIPVLIIAGEQDPFVPAGVALAMHSMIADSELLVVSLGTHTVLVEQPQLINCRIQLFLNERVQDNRESGHGPC